MDMSENMLEGQSQLDQKDVNAIAEMTRQSDVPGSADEKAVLDMVRGPIIAADNEVAPFDGDARQNK